MIHRLYSKPQPASFSVAHLQWVILLLGFTAQALLAVELQVPPPPPVEAKAYAIQDFDSGYLLASNNADQRMEPASLTKIMTAYVVFNELREKHLRLEDTTQISKTAQQASYGGSRMFVQSGSQVTIESLIKGMIIQSGNDASIALAEHIAGSESTFANLMNEHAKRLGMTSSHFVNSSGLPDPNHYTTANDLLRLVRALITEYPQYYTWFSQQEFTFNNISQPNRNILLTQDLGVDGIKTGHTASAGYCYAVSAKRNHMRLNAIILGADSQKQRFQAGRSLLNYGFRFYNTYPLYTAQQSLHQQRLWYGADQQINLGVAQPIYLTIPRGQYKNLSAAIDVDSTITAPITKGTSYGTLRITLADKLLVEQPLVALADIPLGALWQRARDSLLQQLGSQ